MNFVYILAFDYGPYDGGIDLIEASADEEFLEEKAQKLNKEYSCAGRYIVKEIPIID